MQRFFQLETIIRRSPLGLRFIDIARDLPVGDGLLVQAWQYDPTARVGHPTARMATFAPQSSVYSYRTLPGLEKYADGTRPASDWCGSAASAASGAVATEDWTSSSALSTWATTDASTRQANFVVTVEDLQERFLPQLLLLCLPREQLLEVPLFSSPAREPLIGWGAIRGQVVSFDGTQIGAGASWAVVTAQISGRSYVTVADARGVFLIFVPYARFPAPQPGAAPQGTAPVEQISWDVTIQVAYQPTKQVFVPGVVPADIQSIIEQGPAKIYQTLDQAVDVLHAQLPFGRDLLLTTAGQPSRLLIGLAA